MAAASLSSVQTERWFGLSCDALWPLWTTKEGLESWWAPEGFKFEVLTLEVHPGGRIEFGYDDSAMVGNDQWRQELRAKGLSTAWAGRGTFLEVDPARRLVFRQALDFGPRSRTQEYQIDVEFRSEGRGSDLRVTARATPSKHWKLLGRANLLGQMDRLERACQGRATLGK